MRGYCGRCGLRSRIQGTVGRFCECPIGLREYLGMTSKEIEESQDLGFRRTTKAVDWYVSIAIAWLRAKLKLQRLLRKARV